MSAPLSARARAMLRAVAAGRGHLTHSREPDLYVDCLPCCDQLTARQLVHAGLIQPADLTHHQGEHVVATLTDIGRAVLEHMVTGSEQTRVRSVFADRTPRIPTSESSDLRQRIQHARILCLRQSPGSSTLERP